MNTLLSILWTIVVFIVGFVAGTSALQYTIMTSDKWLYKGEIYKMKKVEVKEDEVSRGHVKGG